MFERKASVSLIQQLKRQRKELFDTAVKTRDEQRAAKDESAESKAKVNAMLDDVEKLTKQIDEEERLLAVQDTVEYHEERRADQDPDDPKVKYSQAFRSFIRNGLTDMEPDHRALLQRNQKVIEGRALGVASGSVGGYVVPEDFYGQVVDIMLAYGGIREAGPTVLTTSGGNDLPVPKGDDTANTGEIVTEGSATGSTSDPSFAQMILKGYLYSSKIVKVGIALLQDEAVNLEALLAQWLAIRIARITNTHFTTGDDSDKPDGVLNTAADSGVTSDKETSIAYADLVSLQHSVDPAYQANGRFMFNDGTLALMKKMTTATEKIPLWAPGLAAREPDTILGKPFTVNQDMPAHTTGLKAMVFGDFSQYFVRDVTGATLVRLTERYADYLQVGFMLFSRHDGGLAVPNAIKYLTVGAD